MSGVFFTSDPHLGHAKVAEIRGFDSIEAHDDTVMASYYRALQLGGALWVLGDISSGSSTGEREALQKFRDLREMTGAAIHLIVGNHDSASPIHRNAHTRQRVFMDAFDSVQTFARRRGPGRRDVLLSHYPYPEAGDGPHREGARYLYARIPDGPAWLLHGHTHQPEFRSGPRSLHVGWDAHRGPVAWGEIEQIIEKEEA